MKKGLNPSSAGTLKKVLHRIGHYRWLVLVSLALAAGTVLLTLYVPILVGRAIDGIVDAGHVDFDRIFPILVRIGLCVALTGLGQWVMNAVNNRVTFDVVRDLREEALQHIENLPLSYIDSHPHGETVSRVIADADQFADGLLMGFTQLFTGVLTILVTLGFMFMKSWLIALVVVGVTPLSLFVARFIATRTYAMFRQQSETRGEQTAFIDERIGNLKVVKAYGREAAETERFDEINARLKTCSMRATFFSSITNPATRFVNSVVYALVALTGALSALAGHISVGGLTAFLAYANQYTKPFNEISGVVTELQNAVACAARLFELIEAPAEAPDPPNAGRARRTDRRQGRRGLGGRVLLLCQGPAADRALQPVGESRPARGHRGAHGLRQDHAHQPADALLRSRPGRHPRGRQGHPDAQAAQPPRRLRHGAPGDLAQARHHPREHRHGPA